MAKIKDYDIVVVYKPNGLTLDTSETTGSAYHNDTLLQDFTKTPYKALFYFGFEDKNPDMSDNYPFAFLATYSTEVKGRNKAAHVPLKNALLEYKGKQDLLLRLLTTVDEKMQNMLKNSAKSG